ncbi:MAG TPA: sterol desaturase family protein [Phnomibacter sp.]|nr:sterol desaturase family protein [Phnomibacter sp.]
MFESVRENILLLVSTPLYVIVIGLEILLSNYQNRKIYTWKDTLANIYLMLLNSGIDLLFRSVYVVALVLAFNNRVGQINTPWVYWLVLILSIDMMYYWLHRLEHEVRLFWAVHVTHHSSEHFNFTVGFRSSVFQPLYRFIFFMPLAFVGFKAVDILFIHSAIQTWGILVHTKMINKMGILEWFLVTPSHHRVHHASNALYLDKNMGMLLIIWDKLFGTFQPELSEQAYQPIRYGLTSNIENPNAANLVLHEWKAIGQDLKKKIPLKTKLKYLFAPPGWSHDGSRKTSEQLRLAEAETLPSNEEKVALPVESELVSAYAISKKLSEK